MINGGNHIIAEMSQHQIFAFFRTRKFDVTKEDNDFVQNLKNAFAAVS